MISSQNMLDYSITLWYVVRDRYESTINPCRKPQSRSSEFLETSWSFATSLCG